MESTKVVRGLVILTVILTVLLSSMFTVEQTERALKLRLGKVISADYPPGLHFKYPIVDTVRFFDGRIQTVDAVPEQFLTQEKKNLIVDAFVKWRVIDVISYFTTVRGDPKSAGERLSEIIADGLRSEFGKRTIQEVVSSDRTKIMDIITGRANERVKSFGIEIIDVRIKRIELPPEVSSSVYRRMEAERERVAKELRSRGDASAVRIQAEADRESVEVVAKAERDAEQIRGEGDALATEITAGAYNKNPEFYAFYRSLTAYRKVFSDKSDVLLLQPNSEFFNYFKQLGEQPAVASTLPEVNREPPSPLPLLENLNVR
ncbi:MAG: HflC protein [Beggiatoa sp. IS2]|nr:MAG: HflC protein [Beggiatoa sp. IS2]